MKFTKSELKEMIRECIKEEMSHRGLTEGMTAEEKVDARLILQVHDELIVEAKENEAEKVARILQEEMEKAATLTVRLRADVNVGKTWYDAKQ